MVNKINSDEERMLSYNGFEIFEAIYYGCLMIIEK